MRRLLIILPIIIIVAIAAILTIAFLTPKSVYREQIQTAAENALGRDVSLAGPISLSVFPRIAASVSDVTVANPEGFDGDHMIEAGQLRASVKWLPLMTGRVQVRELALIDANIGLQRLADGRTNWVFANPDAVPETDPEEPGSPSEVNAGFDQARIVNTTLTYSDAMTGDAYNLTELNVEARAQSFSSPLRLKSTGYLDGDLFGIDLDLDTPNALLTGEPADTDLALTTEFANIEFDGATTLGDTPALDGTFAMDIPSLAALADKAPIDISTLPVNLDPVGSLAATGSVNGPLDTLAIQFSELVTDGEALDVRFAGGVTIAEIIALESGSLDVSMGDMGRALGALGIDLAQTAALEGAELTLTSDLNGPVDGMSLNNIDFNLTGPLIETAYTGNVSMADGGRLNGNISASSSNPRRLLDLLGIELEPGETLQNFSFQSDANGSLSGIDLTDLTLTLDGTTANGDLALDLSSDRPKLTGDLSTTALDLTPFMGPAPEDQPEGWSKTPLALDSLKAADADISLKSSSIKIDKMVLSDADIRARLTDGALSAEIAQLTTFGGKWAGTLGLNANRQVPTLAMALTGDSILMQDLLQTLAGSDRLAGTGQFSLDISSAGASVHDIMNALSGELSANLADGAINGVNLGQLFRTTGNIQESLTSGAFNLGISPTDKTDFASFDTLLTIQDGVANIRLMDLVNSALSAKGSGTINLGAQTLNMGLQFAADTAGRGELSDVQLNGLAIPLKIAGSWTKPSIAPDTQALTQALAGEQIDRLTGSIGGELGGALSGILGSSGRSSDRDDTEDNTTDGDEELSREQTVEEAVEDVAREALGSLFRRD
ncbi:MAG: AsmA family protein [Pseudomonadota bacterium]